MPEQLRILRSVDDLARAEITKRPKRSLRLTRATLAQTVFLAVSLLALVLSFHCVDLGATRALLVGLGSKVAWVLVPSLIAISVETLAWRQAFSLLARPPAFFPLFRVRVVTESLGAVLPLGPVWSEAMKPLLLGRQCGLALPVSLTGMIIRKYMLLCSQGLYLALGFVLGRVALEATCARVLGSPRFAVLALVAAAILVLLAETLARVLAGGRSAQWIFNTLIALPSRSLREALARFQRQIEQTDGYATRFFGGAPRGRALVVGSSLVGWLFEASETWVILLLLGTGVSWGNAVGIEAVVILLRHLLFMLPAGLGAQELGYSVLLGALGVGIEASAAFAVVKRLRELVWVLIGYTFLLTETRFGAQKRPSGAMSAQPTLTGFGGE